MSKPETPQKAPYVEDLEPGVYAWCSCGKSTKQPYCDGSHKGTDFSPVIEKLTEAKNFIIFFNFIFNIYTKTNMITKPKSIKMPDIF